MRVASNIVNRKLLIFNAYYRDDRIKIKLMFDDNAIE